MSMKLMLLEIIIKNKKMLMKKSIHILLICLIASASPLAVYALKTPTPFTYDVRVRGVTYNPHDIVQVETVIGVATHIVLEEDERYITHAFGDSEAWAFTNQGNHYFIKPKEDDASTNLTIITDRRTYYFRLGYHETNDALAMYGVVFLYPDTDKKQTNKIARRLEVEQGFTGMHAGHNLSYTMSGDTDIAPVNAWDSGEFTYFKFAGTRDIPGIYMVDADGKESIVNRNVTGVVNDVVVVHKINSKWILRLGRRALAVFNEAYDVEGVASITGTRSPAVLRVIKEDDYE